MVNYQDPVTIAREFTAIVKLWHVVNGIFIWEFVTTLNYEWDVIRGKRPYLWTIWVHSGARVGTLLSVILNMVGFDTTTPIKCQLWISFLAVISYPALIASALLIVLRIIAIWHTKKIIVVIAMGVWVTDLAFHLHGMVVIRSSWSTEANICALTNSETAKPYILASLVSDVVLLFLMLIGLLRLEAGSAFALGRILWKQGLVWLLIATVAEVPSAVLIILNRNVVLNLMFQPLCMVITTIAATRMYRSLIDFGASGLTPPGNGRSVSEMQVYSGTIELNKMDVSMLTDQGPTSRSGYGSYITTDPEEHYRAHKVNLDVDMESGPEK